MHLPKYMSCHKAIKVITGKEHCFHDCMYIYYAHTSSVRFEDSVCRGSLITTLSFLLPEKANGCREPFYYGQLPLPSYCCFSVFVNFPFLVEFRSDVIKDVNLAKMPDSFAAVEVKIASIFFAFSIFVLLLMGCSMFFLKLLN